MWLIQITISIHLLGVIAIFHVVIAAKERITSENHHSKSSISCYATHLVEWNCDVELRKAQTLVFHRQSSVEFVNVQVNEVGRDAISLAHVESTSDELLKGT